MVRGGPSRATANYSAGAQRGAVDGVVALAVKEGLFRYMLAAAAAEFVTAYRQCLACPL